MVHPDLRLVKFVAFGTLFAYARVPILSEPIQIFYLTTGQSGV